MARFPVTELPRCVHILRNFDTAHRGVLWHHTWMELLRRRWIYWKDDVLLAFYPLPLPPCSQINTTTSWKEQINRTRQVEGERSNFCWISSVCLTRIVISDSCMRINSKQACQWTKHVDCVANFTLVCWTNNRRDLSISRSDMNYD